MQIFLRIALTVVLSGFGREAAGQSLEPVNAELPTWLRLGGEYRNRWEGFIGRGFRPDVDDGHSLSRVRINMQIQPRKWLQLTFQGHDARVYGNRLVPDAPLFENPIDLRLGFVEIGSRNSSPVALRLGRQEIGIGEERLLGSSNWANSARSFDAIRLMTRLGRMRVDAFAASVVVQTRDGFDRPSTGDNLHGLLGQAEIRKFLLEPFLLWRVAPSARSETGATGKLDHKTVGFRLTGKLTPATELVTELAGQTGSWGADSMATWAGHWRVVRTLAQDKRVPKIRLEYDYARGDRAPRDGKHETFELLYPTPHDKLGLADQVGWKNIHHIGAIAEWQPNTTWTLQTKYQTWWLASVTDGVYNAGGTLLARDPAGLSGRHVGHEIDLQALIAASKVMRIGGGVGHIFPGEFLHRTTPGAGYTFPYVMLTWSF